MESICFICASWGQWGARKEWTVSSCWQMRKSWATPERMLRNLISKCVRELEDLKLERLHLLKVSVGNTSSLSFLITCIVQIQSTSGWTKLFSFNDKFFLSKINRVDWSSFDNDPNCDKDNWLESIHVVSSWDCIQMTTICMSQISSTRFPRRIQRVSRVCVCVCVCVLSWQ